MENVTKLFLLGAATAVLPLFAFIAFQSYATWKQAKTNAFAQAKMNESYLPIKVEETRQLKIIQEREFQIQEHTKEMRGDNDL